MTKDEIIAEKNAALTAAVGVIRELEQLVAELQRPPYTTATVLALLKGGTEVLLPGGRIVPAPESKKLKGKLQPGVIVGFNQAEGVAEVYDDIAMPGIEVEIKRVFANGTMEIEGGGSGRARVYQGRVEGKVKAGDTVLLDASGSVALELIPKDTTNFTADTNTGVTWDDIGGQEEAKASLREAVEGPLTHAKLFEAYKKRPIKGMLLSGPPGTGKTLLAKATANAIRSVFGATAAKDGFIYVKGPEVLNMWVGNTESQIRSLFKRAREHKAEHGYPAVLFIDEADAILGKRGTHVGSVLSSTIVPTFLAEMDGMNDSGAFVLLATNRPDVLDPAVVRDGRIDRKVIVARPSKTDSVHILKIYFKKTKACDEVEKLAATAADLLFDESNMLYRVGLKSGGVKPFTMANLVSGAMLAGVVDESASMAIKRDIKAGGNASGIVCDDVTLAVRRLVNANRHLNHDDDLTFFAEHHGDAIGSVQKVAA